MTESRACNPIWIFSGQLNVSIPIVIAFSTIKANISSYLITSHHRIKFPFIGYLMNKVSIMHQLHKMRFIVWHLFILYVLEFNGLLNCASTTSSKMSQYQHLLTNLCPKSIKNYGIEIVESYRTDERHVYGRG